MVLAKLAALLLSSHHVVAVMNAESTTLLCEQR